MSRLINQCIGILILLMTVSCNITAQENKIDAYMQNLVKEKKIAGAAVAVLKNNQLLFNINYGWADAENNIEVTDTTAFNIMSVTKNFIAIAVMQLPDKNKIDLAASIRKYISKLPQQYDSIKIYQLMNHSSGVPDYVHKTGYMLQANRTQTPMEILKPVISDPLDFAPGEKNEYSNSGYFLLGLLIEKVSGETLKKYLNENIFKPYGLNNTYLDDGSSIQKTKGYTSIHGELKKELPLNPSQYWAAGGIISTKDDLIKWNEAIMSGKVLPLNEINQMMQPTPLTNGKLSDYGLGFELMNTPEIKIAGNNGAGLGFNASDIHFLNDGLTIIILTNTSNGNSSLIAKDIRDIIINETGSSTQATSSVIKDKLDTIVTQVFNDAIQSVVEENNFIDKNAADKFKSETMPFIQTQGNLLGVQMQGEKINPQSIVRRYELRFEKSTTNWVIIFSTGSKIILTNHM
jgi:D-alanyl-D-alanine carboxypeptidase